MEPAASLARIATNVQNLGFRKRAGLIFTLPIDDVFIGWLGLNQASRAAGRGQSFIHPVIGVRDQTTESFVTAARGLREHQYIPPTVSTPLRYLVPKPQRMKWTVGKHADNDFVIGNLIHAIKEFGAPYLSEMASRAAVATELATDVGRGWDHAEERLPIVLALMGREEEAFSAIDKAQTALTGRTDQAAADLSKVFKWERRNVPGLAESLADE